MPTSSGLVKSFFDSGQSISGRNEQTATAQGGHAVFWTAACACSILPDTFMVKVELSVKPSGGSGAAHTQVNPAFFDCCENSAVRGVRPPPYTSQTAV